MCKCSNIAICRNWERHIHRFRREKNMWSSHSHCDDFQAFITHDYSFNTKYLSSFNFSPQQWAECTVACGQCCCFLMIYCLHIYKLYWSACLYIISYMNVSPRQKVECTVAHGQCCWLPSIATWTRGTCHCCSENCFIV